MRWLLQQVRCCMYVVEELIPESQSGGEHESADLSTIGFIIGFAIMMVLDVALG